MRNWVHTLYFNNFVCIIYFVSLHVYFFSKFIEADDVLFEENVFESCQFKTTNENQFYLIFIRLVVNLL